MSKGKKTLKEYMAASASLGGYPSPVVQPQDTENASYSSTKNVNGGSLTISANAKSMEELHSILALAGIDFDTEKHGAYCAPDDDSCDNTSDDEPDDTVLYMTSADDCADDDVLCDPTDGSGGQVTFSAPITNKGVGTEPVNYSTNRQQILDRLMQRMSESLKVDALKKKRRK